MPSRSKSSDSKTSRSASQDTPESSAASSTTSSTPSLALDTKSALGGRPFFVLGVDSDADSETVRARYLELVRRYPPDRDPVMFAKIRYAYESASDPIVFAQRLLAISSVEPRSWKEVIDDNAARPPRLPLQVLLSLGNRRHASQSAPASDQTNETETGAES